MKPTVADSRTPNRLILRGPAGDLPPVTAEAAGSSPVVPAILFSRLEGMSPKTPTHNPAHILLHQFRSHPERLQELSLRAPCFIAVFLRVQIEGRLNLRVPQDSLHGLGFDFRLVHQPVA